MRDTNVSMSCQIEGQTADPEHPEGHGEASSLEWDERDNTTSEVISVVLVESSISGVISGKQRKQTVPALNAAYFNWHKRFLWKVLMNSDEEDEVVARSKHVTLVLCFIVFYEGKKGILTKRACYTIPEWICDAVTCRRKWKRITMKERVFVFRSARWDLFETALFWL